MRILYIYAHPNPQSLNANIRQQGLEFLAHNHAIITQSDLYKDRFKATADHLDSTMNIDEIDQQYFLAQQTAYQQNMLSQDIKAEIEKISDADHIIFQFPLWWFAVPAILKGWLDRVLIKGFAYDSDRVFENGLLSGKTASFTITTQSSNSTYTKDGTHGATISEFMLPFVHTLRFVGIKPLNPFVIYSAFNLDNNQRQKIFKEYRIYLQRLIKEYTAR